MSGIDPFKVEAARAEWPLYRDRRVVGRVVPDAKWPGMWRVQLPGGLSEMVNLARARDAALDWSATPRCHKVLQQKSKAIFGPSVTRALKSPDPSPGRLEKRTGAHERICILRRRMSAFGGKADMTIALQNVRL